MADHAVEENSAVLPNATVLFEAQSPCTQYNNDENSPLSPGEIRMMRNHPKVASVLFSPARKTRGEGKIKPKSFSSALYSSPTRKTVCSLNPVRYVLLSFCLGSFGWLFSCFLLNKANFFSLCGRNYKDSKRRREKHFKFFNRRLAAMVHLWEVVE